MAYAVRADLEEYFGTAELLIASDRDGNGTADPGVINAGLAFAESEINSYLAVKYELPLATAPPILKQVACDLAMYNMSNGTASMTDDKKERKKSAVNWLKDVAKGIASLGLQAETALSKEDVQVTATSESRLFTRARMAGL